MLGKLGYSGILIDVDNEGLIILLLQRIVLKNHTSGEEKILFLNSAQEKDKTHFMDQESGVEMELEENIALLEWLANNYKNFGAALEIITGLRSCMKI